MSFVIGKEPKGKVFQDNREVPGPGEYKLQCSQMYEQSAPFNSSSLKMSSFDIEPVTAGPGSYDPIYHKSMNSDTKKRMTSCFHSKVQRFRTQENQPSSKVSKDKIAVTLTSNSNRATFKQIIDKTKSKMQEIQQQNQKRKVQSIGVNKEYVRIILSNPKNTELLQSIYVEKNIIRRDSGPGSYDIEKVLKSHQKSSKAMDWSRDTQCRFMKTKKEDPIPGPGHYSTQGSIKKNERMSASFAYQGVRSYMDEIIYKTKMPFKIQIIEEQKLKDRYPGPGQYQITLAKSKSFHQGWQAFGSSLKYLEENQYLEQEIPGPAYYNIIINQNNKKRFKQSLKQVRQKIFGKTKRNPKKEKVVTLENTNKDEIIKHCRHKMENYVQRFYSLDERCSSKYGNLPQAQRFTNIEQKKMSETPGPGSYKVSNKVQQKQLKGMFNSTAHRLTQNASRSDAPYYEIGRHDIGRKSLKMKRNIQNLRQIDIIKAPFNCNEIRFDLSQQNKKQKQKVATQTEIDWIKKTNKIKKALISISKGKANNKQSSTFKSTSKRQYNLNQSSIGPGQYLYDAGLQKKSFNQQYNYIAPQKIRSTFRHPQKIRSTFRALSSLS